ncbi:MAG: hypothetical protein ACOYWZ_15000 [Bacillota bacterium]
MGVKLTLSNYDAETATFLGLTDTPNIYVPNKIVAVNSTGNGLIFRDPFYAYSNFSCNTSCEFSAGLYDFMWPTLHNQLNMQGNPRIQCLKNGFYIASFNIYTFGHEPSWYTGFSFDLVHNDKTLARYLANNADNDFPSIYTTTVFMTEGDVIYVRYNSPSNSVIFFEANLVVTYIGG